MRWCGHEKKLHRVTNNLHMVCNGHQGVGCFMLFLTSRCLRVLLTLMLLQATIFLIWFCVSDASLMLISIKKWAVLAKLHSLFYKREEDCREFACQPVEVIQISEP